MRLNARTGAALLVIVIGVVFIVIAALGSNARLPGTLKAAPPLPVPTGTIPPLKIETGVQTADQKKALSDSIADRKAALNANIFDTEYGDRGKHKVVVTIKAGGVSGYTLKWRDGKSEQGTTAGLTRERTITGGFPLDQVAVQGMQATATCTITVDGAEKVHQTASKRYGIAFCTG